MVMAWTRLMFICLFVVGCDDPVRTYVQLGMYDESASGESWWQEQDRLMAAEDLAKGYAKSELQWIQPSLVICEREERPDTDELLYSCRVYPPRRASFMSHAVRLTCSLEPVDPVCWSMDDRGK